MLDLRPQRKWARKADNTVLEIQVPRQTEAKLVGLLGSFRETLHETLQQIANSLQNLDLYCCQLPLIVDSEAELARMLQTLQAERFLAFRVFNEELRSYKGYCTWIGVHSRHGIHLVDTVRLRDSQNELRMLFENPNIVKLGISIDQQLQWLQRDFSIFSINCLDIKELLANLGLPTDIFSLSELLFNQTIDRPERSQLLYTRPIAIEQRDYLADSTSLTLRLISRHQQYFSELPRETMENAYINSNYHCRNPYRHRAETIEELSNTIFTGKENSSPNGTSQVNLKRLAKWREHTAKMKDESVEYILPTKILKQIILRDIKSMLELRYLYSEYEEKEVNRDSMSEIIGILLEKKKKFDPEKMQEEVERCLDQPEMLFKEAGWMDKEWRNNDFESLKLYKEIISMKELEPSIIESELNSTESKTLSNGQLMCLFQYAKNWEDPSLLKHYYKEFKENRFDNEEQSDLNGKPSKPEEQRNFRDRFPESIKEIYELANRKKKEMKKEKKRASEEKEEPFNLNVREFLRSIDWA